MEGRMMYEKKRRVEDFTHLSNKLCQPVPHSFWGKHTARKCGERQENLPRQVEPKKERERNGNQGFGTKFCDHLEKLHVVTIASVTPDFYAFRALPSALLLFLMRPEVCAIITPDPGRGNGPSCACNLEKFSPKASVMCLGFPQYPLNGCGADNQFARE